jgi:hypothetical protein
MQKISRAWFSLIFVSKKIETTMEEGRIIASSSCHSKKKNKAFVMIFEQEKIFILLCQFNLNFKFFLLIF